MRMCTYVSKGFEPQVVANTTLYMLYLYCETGEARFPYSRCVVCVHIINIDTRALQEI